VDEPLRVLIVEDEPILAFQLEDEILEAGHQVVGCAQSRAEALDLVRTTRPDVVFLDMQLADGPTGLRTAFDLAADHQLVVFVTGSARDLPPDLGGAMGVIDKPWSSHGMRSALHFISKALGEGVPPPPPTSLRLSSCFHPGKTGLYAWA
jgi:AmiR/NasT family two-component response regulator